jgi:chemotaxis protein histidine kinase CheA
MDTRGPEGVLRDQISSLADKFMKRTADQLCAFQEQLRAFAHGDRSVLASIGLVAHKIHGSGAVFGFSRISEAAGTLEHLIAALDREIIPADSATSAQQLERLSAAVEQLARVVEEERAAGNSGRDQR